MNPALMQRYQPYMDEWLETKRNDTSEAGWINGVYFGRVVGAALSKSAKYPDDPIDFYGTSRDDETEEFTDADRFWAWAQTFNKQHELKENKTEASMEDTGAQVDDGQPKELCAEAHEGTDSHGEGDIPPG